MTRSRIDIFKEMLTRQPDDVMVWYGLATEYGKVSDWPEAVNALNQVIRLKPDYTAAYQMLGSALAAQGDTDRARQAWRDGIAMADRTGAWKAKQHMERLLAEADSPSTPGFCS